MDALPPLTRADAASMSLAVRALVIVHGVRARLTRQQRARLSRQRAAVDANGDGGVMYDASDAAATTITPADLARLTPNAARWTCAALWASDFKWASVEGGVVVTHVHFGYARAYGGHARDPADLDRLRLRGARILWTLRPRPISRLVRRIEVPLTHAKYVAVVWGR